MSLINLAGNLLTPDYQALYLVSSSVMDEAKLRGANFDGVVGRLVEDSSDSRATIEVSSKKVENDNAVNCSYINKDTQKNFQVKLVDYTSPSLPPFKRRKYMKEQINIISKDTSASIFVPSCSKFQRLGFHAYPTNINRTQMTPQGAFSFTSLQPRNDWRFITCLVFVGIIMGIIGGVTHFSSGKASISQVNSSHLLIQCLPLSLVSAN
jgi:hypothetical protein